MNLPFLKIRRFFTLKGIIKYINRKICRRKTWLHKMIRYFARRKNKYETVLDMCAFI